MLQPYSVLAQAAEYEEEIKKSRFITLLQRTQGRDAAMAFVNQIKVAHPGARHHCWGFIASAPSVSTELGFSDDGEPSGTAGKPILAALQGSGLGEVTAVVVRYSGGIKLGTGGLVRAYGGGVQAALKLAQTVIEVPQVTGELTCQYAHVSLVEQLLAQFNGQIIESDFGVAVLMHITIDARNVGAFKQSVFDKSQGQLVFRAEQDTNECQ
ncbi:YigZ family protein [Motilimonas eburnea]|uniref:YigZ family protein n=1 Tax=Motilimonas eburnea TaxID=1737488 RepID=UPI001E2C396C|nr:YigZ family protein [Motilimonas eburnea]MCE2573634.1 YigZ family protein [Motilimonas eburnea]